MKKRLLNISMCSTNVSLNRAFETIYDCYHIDWVKYGINCRTLQYDVLYYFNEFKPDYVFLHLHTDKAVFLETILELTKSSKVINWTGDVRHPLPNHYIDIGKHIFLTLFTNMNDVNESISRGIKSDFLQVGYDDYYFTPDFPSSTSYQDILFLGSNYFGLLNYPLSEYRRSMVYSLKNEFGSNFGFYGIGWDSCNGIINNFYEEGTAYRSCKIGINLSHFAYSRYSSDRLFRIMGSGCFCLTHRYPDIEVDFIDGKHLVIWDSIEDLIDKIKYYLAHEKERKEIAKNGCELVRKNFTWINFAQNLDSLINKHE